MTSLPHVFLCIDLNIDGKVVKGISSEGLPPKWFTKNSDPKIARYVGVDIALNALQTFVDSRIRRNDRFIQT